MQCETHATRLARAARRRADDNWTIPGRRAAMVYAWQGKNNAALSRRGDTVWVLVGARGSLRAVRLPYHTHTRGGGEVADGFSDGAGAGAAERGRHSETPFVD